MSDKKSVAEKTDGDVQITEGHLGDLKPDPWQTRKHNPRNIGVIVDSLQKVGFGRSLVADEDNHVICGNGTMDAAGEIGMERVIFVDAPRDAVIVRRVHGLSQSEKLYLAASDNRANELSEFDPKSLQFAITQGGLEWQPLWTPDEISPVLEADWTPETEGEMPTHDAPHRNTITLTEAQMALVARVRDFVDEETQGADECDLALAVEYACKLFIQTRTKDAPQTSSTN